jgi:hypothetical protein
LPLAGAVWPAPAAAGAPASSEPVGEAAALLASFPTPAADGPIEETLTLAWRVAVAVVC